MSVDPRAFPGVAEIQTGVAGAGANTLTVTLPTPPAGSRQYLTMILITLGTGGGNTNGGSVTVVGLDVGGGSAPVYEVGTSAQGTTFDPLSLGTGWPASALASAISVTIGSFAATFGATVRCTLWGYNVAE